jgi:predicted Rdx family selenoprotein
MEKISLKDFDFILSGYGHYKVAYISPKTGKKWICTTNNVQLIDRTKNEDYPTQKNLKLLKNLCKNN